MISNKETPLYVVGDTVYRANWDKVEKGEVTRIERCDLNSQGNIRLGSPTGKYILHTAKFGYDYESQTYEWKFFHNIENAYARLAELVDNRIIEAKRDLARWESIKSDASIKSKPVNEQV